MQHSAAFHLGLHCLPESPLYKVKPEERLYLDTWGLYGRRQEQMTCCDLRVPIFGVITVTCLGHCFGHFNLIARVPV